MKLPKTFVPDKKNYNVNLEKILGQRVYYIPKDWMSIKVCTVNGDLIESKTLDASNISDENLKLERKVYKRITDLEHFKFFNRNMFSARFGNSMKNLAIFDKNLNEVILTPSHLNPSYCVFERKSDADVLMMNTTSDDYGKDTVISYYDGLGDKLGEFHANVSQLGGYGRDTLTDISFPIKTKKQNYLVLNYFYHLSILDEDLKIIQSFHTSSIQKSQRISVVNLDGKERIVVLGYREHEKRYGGCHVLKIFDDNFDLVEELNAERFDMPCFKPGVDQEDFQRGHEEVYRCESSKFNGQEYLLFTHRDREKNKNYLNLRVLNTGFEEVFSVKHVKDGWNIRVGKLNGKDCLFVPHVTNFKDMIHVYDENFELRDKFPIANSGLLGSYRILNIQGIDYFACLQEGHLNFYSGDFPLNGTWFKKKQPTSSIKLRKEKEHGMDYSLQKIISFQHKDEDFLALEYWHNECIDLYDSDFKFVRSFPGGDFCVV